ncbi:hypothetical protein EJ03DRAFT_30963 [Teratosphaeria nubilosa]|uniref:Uncharacterized protein n=1 Tax=Teratosphaeria nubilosa TaxID=161662 RepID=A0A6G1LGI6_9PEZI|nr:hypothetical protein EJ03DRAFT_30963 [Teratosphaeria nubilosa]
MEPQHHSEVSVSEATAHKPSHPNPPHLEPRSVSQRNYQSKFTHRSLHRSHNLLYHHITPSIKPSTLQPFPAKPQPTLLSHPQTSNQPHFSSNPPFLTPHHQKPPLINLASQPAQPTALQPAKSYRRTTAIAPSNSQAHGIHPEHHLPVGENSGLHQQYLQDFLSLAAGRGEWQGGVLWFPRKVILR